MELIKDFEKIFKEDLKSNPKLHAGIVSFLESQFQIYVDDEKNKLY